MYRSDHYNTLLFLFRSCMQDFLVHKRYTEFKREKKPLSTEHLKGAVTLPTPTICQWGYKYIRADTGTSRVCVKLKTEWQFQRLEKRKKTMTHAPWLWIFKFKRIHWDIVTGCQLFWNERNKVENFGCYSNENRTQNLKTRLWFFFIHCRYWSLLNWLNIQRNLRSFFCIY